MERKLKKVKNEIYYYEDGKKIAGVHEKIRGNVSYIRGNVSCISGDISGICGDVSCICGDIDDCNITEEERKNGICVSDLICEEKGE